MIEIYLFVNPLGGICLEIEKDILALEYQIVAISPDSPSF